MTIGSGCRVHLTDGELPSGRLVAALSKHYTAVLDGVVHDTYNPQRENVTFRTFPGWHFARLKLGERIDPERGGVVGISRRCVYGYWLKV